MEAEHTIPSFLARDIRDGRLGVPVNRYTARLLVGDADCTIPLKGRHSAIIPPSREWAVPKRTVGEWVRFDMMVPLFFQWAWFEPGTASGTHPNAAGSSVPAPNEPVPAQTTDST